MDLDTTLVRYFRTVDLEKVGAETLTSGIECCQADLGLEQDRGKRFALWAMLYLLGSSPDLEVAREDLLIGTQPATSWIFSRHVVALGTETDSTADLEILRTRPDTNPAFLSEPV